MEYTEDQKATFQAEFRKRRIRQIVLAIPIILAMVVMFMAEDGKEASIGGFSIVVLAPIFIVFVIGAIVFSLYNWRCPACGKYLGRTISPKFCVKCGIPLQ